MQTLIAIIKLALFLLITAIIVPLQFIILLFTKKTAAFLLPRLWHKCVCKTFGITYMLEGTKSANAQTLFACNHLSYLDIPLLGGILPQTSFLAKSDVQHWPLFGTLSKLQQTAFIERKRTAMKEETKKLGKKIHGDKDRNLVIFAEGTSSDGLEVKPFKSSLFAILLENTSQNLVVQPVTIKLVTTNKETPDTIEKRRIYTWPLEDDIPLHAHLWRFAKSKGAHLTIIFHAPIIPSEFSERKTLAKTCHDRVSIGLEK